ncbi:MAG: TIGR04086 family membrane protein [Oscillospiraceae bacterium]|nr:TIGR04086 family membrane protein [Oscillospiraceae bacterium]
MRRQKRNYRFKPYLIGVLSGYAAMVLTILPAALILTLMKSAAKTAGAAAVIAMMAGGFVCGKTAGFVRQKDGLKTGFLCGLAFAVPMTIFTLIFGDSTVGTLILKIALCASFAAVGGVSGVSN